MHHHLAQEFYRQQMFQRIPGKILVPQFFIQKFSLENTQNHAIFHSNFIQTKIPSTFKHFSKNQQFYVSPKFREHFTLFG